MDIQPDKHELLISVIIPIYNVEQYLERCLQSVANQVDTNIEVILVDDGAADHSAAIAQRFVEKDSRFRLVHRPNGGLSAARNTGLKLVQGDYVFYLDSDDYLAENCLNELVKTAVQTKAEVVQTNFYYAYPDYLLCYNRPKEKIVCYERETAMDKLLEQKEIKNFAWGKLIRMDIAQKYPFPEGRFFEDTFWMYHIVHDCQKYALNSQPMLYYLQRPTGISGGFSTRNLDQLEGEAGRLHFLKKNYPTKFYQKGLAAFNQKILAYTNTVEQLPAAEKTIFLRQIARYSEMFQLKKEFPALYFIAGNKILSPVSRFWKRGIQAITNCFYFKKSDKKIL